MAMATYSSDTIETQDASVSRQFNEALETRASARRSRRSRRLIYLAIVATAVVIAVFYGGVVAAPRFSAETRFSVRGSAQAGGSSAPATSLISTGASQGAMAFVDGFAVNDFLKSRDCMRQLGRQVDLRALLNRNPLESSSEQPNEEQLYRAYTNTVNVTFNMLEQVNVVRVDAFSPRSSQRIATVLLHLAQGFVARMDTQGVADALDVSARQVTSTEKQAIDAGSAISHWRAMNRNIDPQAEAGMVMQIIGQIEQELATARINYEKVRAFGNPDHPMLMPAQQQVAALERQLAQAHGRLTGTGNSEAVRLKSYDQLKNEQIFADNNLAAARSAYQQAFLEAMRLRRYLMVIARPVPEDQPSSPRLDLLALEGLLAGVFVAFATSLGLSFVKSRS